MTIKDIKRSEETVLKDRAILRELLNPLKG